MNQVLNVAVFEGDGIGPEIMAPTVDILRLLTSRASTYGLNFISLKGGATHYQKTGVSLPDDSLSTARKADAILLSAMGLPSVRYPDGTEISPQIDLRKKLNLFAGVRPVTVLPGQASPIARPDGKPIDFVLVRESTEGLFWSQGCGEVSHDEARETLVITRKTSQKLFEFTFKLAEQRRKTGRGKGLVTCVDKANVFRAFAFFREIFDAEAGNHADIAANHAYVDATALWMVQKPWEFDVLVTENMFGDILSDLGAGLMGGLGLAPSADIGEGHAVFQPCHGSAPDIAGQGVANPFAMILSAAMMLDWLGHEHDNKELLEHSEILREAVNALIMERKFLTRDLGGTSNTGAAANAIKSKLRA
ncbi:isocitrate/isopropylmalate dehydrogenase family protein [Pelagibius sp. Alg239-R121]|uniref:isocitrate/isopropylmalate dehydrogenase family protein n=1 Tax=Pelagibius sp. Alg239-R121 TaxID=2993448 RepID=UPI0024A779FC|nr:isocitrate/isopropylmalate family dehydrogenase [Pelagibius sp. Alg239-R121]